MKDFSVSQDAQLALVKLLFKLDLIGAAQATTPFTSTDQCPISYFAAQGCFDEDDAVRIVADKLHIPICIIDKELASSVNKLLEHTLLTPISIERWQKIHAIPIEVDEKTVVIAMANPLDQHALKALRFDLGCTIKEAIAKESDILDILGRKVATSQVFDLDSLIDKDGILPAEPTDDALSRLESNVADNDVAAPPVVRLVNRIFSASIQADASDIHVNPEKDCLAIRIRVDGMLQPLFSVPAQVRNATISRIKLLAGMDIAEKRKPQDGRLRIKTSFGIKDLRVSTVPTIYGENVVIRILSSDLTRITFDNLGIPAKVQEMMKRSLTGSSRVFLVTGPTGSGKTSTLYGCLLMHRDGTSNIVTIEDPIEYRIQGINQIQVNNKIGVTFAEGLRSVLRQDPDVIMVGEIRDYDTCSIAMQAAQTGHLVLSTLHTNSAAAAVTRMRDLGIPSYLIASSLGSVVAQRLMRRLCPVCSTPFDSSEIAARFPDFHIDPSKTRKAVGCNECCNTGYKGRAGLFSFLEITDPVREAIRLDLSEQEIESRAKESGFRSLLEEAVDLLNSGSTTIEEVERVMGSLENLAASMRVPNSAAAPTQTHSSQMPPIQTFYPSALPGNPLSKRRVLLVEDDENTSMVLKMLLQREMFDVDLAQNGLEGLEKTYQNPPNIIVCDLMMPHMDGVEMVQKLRRDGRINSIPVLMLTAADTEENEIHVLDCGADDFVSKTADSKVMLARIHRLLDR